jgi:hypothetical protein
LKSPTLSVVVTIVDGGAALQRCLDGLTTQDGAPLMEILVPYDESVQSVASHAGEFPSVRFLEIGRLQTGRAATSAAAQHELVDRRRAAGLAATRGELVALVEDRAVPRSDWAATIVRLHAQFPNLVIGGAVENGLHLVLNWAVYFCDFGRYQLPIMPGPRRYVTDVNVSYKRRALEQTCDIWRSRYHEPLVHGALERAGESLLLVPDIVVEQFRDNLTLASLVRERFAWGRLFGSLRVRDASPARRLVLTSLSPLLPAVLFVRFLKDRWVKRVPIRTVVSVVPAVIVLLCAWVAGEAAGYATGSD